MSITGSGMYGLTLEKMFNNGAAIDLEAEDNKVAMVEDGYTPNFDTHDFFNDLTNEVSGTGYTTGGVAITSTEITIGAPAAGKLKWAGGNTSWTSSTIPNAMAAVLYCDSVASDPLIILVDFVTAASTTAGTFAITWHADGIFNLDYVP